MTGATWSQAEAAALTGTRIRRAGWVDKWLIYDARLGFWFFIPRNPYTASESTPFIVTCDLFTFSEFLAKDWTDQDPGLIPTPTVDYLQFVANATGSTNAKIDDDIRITVDGKVIYTPVSGIFGMDPHVVTVTQADSGALHVGAAVILDAANFGGVYSIRNWTTTVYFTDGSSFVATGGLVQNGDDGVISPNIIYRPFGSFEIGLPNA